MKAEEQNIAIAQALGWKNLHVWPGSEHLIGTHPNQYSPDVPLFTTDANTRPEMLVALNVDQKTELIELLFWGQLFVSHDEISEKNLHALLELSQPKFAELWLKVKGLWKE